MSRINLSHYCLLSTKQVHIRSSMIIDGVCIRWRGWIDLERLDGVGCLEYDEDRGRIEEAILKEQIEQYKMRMREFEERQRLFKMAQAEHQKKNSATAPVNNNNTTAVAATIVGKNEVSTLHYITHIIYMVNVKKMVVEMVYMCTYIYTL